MKDNKTSIPFFPMHKDTEHFQCAYKERNLLADNSTLEIEGRSRCWEENARIKGRDTDRRPSLKLRFKE
jgi:hypothetical protein